MNIFCQRASLKRSKQEYTKERRVKAKDITILRNMWFAKCHNKKKQKEMRILYLKHKEGNSCNIPGTEKNTYKYV